MNEILKNPSSFQLSEIWLKQFIRIVDPLMPMNILQNDVRRIAQNECSQLELFILIAALAINNEVCKAIFDLVVAGKTIRCISFRSNERISRTGEWLIKTMGK